MSEKRVNQYKLTLEYLKNSKGEEMQEKPIELLFQNHDNIYKILEVLQEKDLFGDNAQTIQFAIGLKLFGDIIMRNRDLALFEDMQPAFVAFMKKLKSK
ncbi:DUF3861 domain-containing protein [Agriterribacter sp.]|uniref:DUF3861 domain-containing protein n=1 Tax=Agriterribacter sp. TaxID=2821509 RepID=UPI002BD39DB6|nr:DUF3861 domain-containing protein [Agriterribacter sp.]HRO47486.1 DUF3861 domain-containing protein [Agriterribacter sp.]HRQ18599.1 DUF3861 domain-containing protein [Agriterribacter sp.]